MLKLNKNNSFETDMLIVYPLQTGVYEAHYIVSHEKKIS